MPIACFIFSLFKLNVLFFSYWVVAWLWHVSWHIFSLLTGVENGRFIRWKCLLFQFSCRRIHEICRIFQIPILGRVQNGRLLSWKKNHILLKKCSSWSLISKMKVTCMPVACFIFWFFSVNAFFSVLILWHKYTLFLSNRGSKWTHL